MVKKTRCNLFFRATGWWLALFCLWQTGAGRAVESVFLTEVPDYTWYGGCFGTATGNLMGYWDRHGLAGFYTGPTANGIAPLNSSGGNVGIRSMWATKAGFDGRPAGQYGHLDDYWVLYVDDTLYSYESTVDDPWVTSGRLEHSPDCIGDFIGSSQKKWADLNGECAGNMDGFSFTFWDRDGARRTNFVPKATSGDAIPDVPSGLRAWTQFRGYDCEVTSQLTDFNPTVPAGRGFSFRDLKSEIDAGYPVLLFMQRFTELSRNLNGMPRANPNVHGMVAFGYHVEDDGSAYVRYKTSWGGSGDNRMSAWTANNWEADLPVRGVVTCHPLPKITHIRTAEGKLSVSWDGPSSELFDLGTGNTTPLHWYVLERSFSVVNPEFEAITPPTRALEVTIPVSFEKAAFFRVRLVKAPSGG